MKTNRHLAQLIIRDLSKFSGMTFERQDVLTRDEAAKVAAWARTNPAVVKAYLNKGDQEHGSVKLFAEVVNHFAFDHPQQGAAPAAWTDGALRDLDAPIGDMTAAEAEARLAWGTTRAEFREALADKHNPEHAGLVEAMRELRERVVAGAPQTETTERGADTSGSATAATAKAAQGRIDALMRDPAYQKPSHPHHRAAVEAVQAAYEARASQPAGSAVSSVVHPLTPLERIRAAEQNPAYRNPRDPGHAAVLADVTEAYQQLHPPASADGAQGSPAAAPAPAAPAAAAP